jgi:hypothetical protein
MAGRGVVKRGKAVTVDAARDIADRAGVAPGGHDARGRASHGGALIAAVARAMGAEGATVERPQDLGEQLREALRSGRPAVLDVRIDREARPTATASWDLPPLPYPLPEFGWQEDNA